MYEYGFFQPERVPVGRQRGTPRFFVDFFTHNAQGFLGFFGFASGVFLNDDMLPNPDHPSFLYYHSKKQIEVFSPVVDVRVSITSGFVVFKKAVERDIVLCNFTQAELLLLFWNNFFTQFRKYLFETKKLSKTGNYIHKSSAIDAFVKQHVDPCNMLAFVTNSQEHSNKPTVEEIDAAIIASLCQMIVFSRCNWSLKCDLFRSVLFLTQKMFEMDSLLLDFLPEAICDPEPEVECTYRC